MQDPIKRLLIQSCYHTLIIFLIFVCIYVKLNLTQQKYNSTKRMSANKAIIMLLTWKSVMHYCCFSLLTLNIEVYAARKDSVKLKSDRWMLVDLYGICRGYFVLKLSPTSGRCPWWLIFFKNLLYQNKCKETMNIGGGQIMGALFKFFVVKKCPFLCLPDAALSF